MEPSPKDSTKEPLPPIPASRDIALLPFRAPPPHRRIAMVWRRSSAMGDFLAELAGLFASLPAELLETRTEPVSIETRRPSR